MLPGVPYFMKDEEWYTFNPDDSERAYRLTDKAPKKARESYEEFYSDIDDDDEE